MLKPTERSGDLVITGFLFCIGLYVIIDSKIMPSGQFEVSGPGTFPRLLGMVLCVVCIVSSIQTYLKRTNIGRIDIGHRDAWLIIVATIVLGIFLKTFGFIIMVALFIFFLLKLLSNLGWIKSIIVSAAGAIIAFILFDMVLGIQLPRGDLF